VYNTIANDRVASCYINAFKDTIT